MQISLSCSTDTEVFAAIDAIATVICKEDGALYELSRQNLVDCSMKKVLNIQYSKYPWSLNLKNYSVSYLSVSLLRPLLLVELIQKSAIRRFCVFLVNVIMILTVTTLQFKDAIACPKLDKIRFLKLFKLNVVHDPFCNFLLAKNVTISFGP